MQSKMQILSALAVFFLLTAPMAFAQQAQAPASPKGEQPMGEMKGMMGSGMGADESAFMNQNKTVMDKMMQDMMVKPTGDVDRDFAAMMIPHHQGAIDMARIYLRYGHNAELKRLAKKIIVDQQREIKIMNKAVGK
jgi:uncharacterized protein (DUF305 family)